MAGPSTLKAMITNGSNSVGNVVFTRARNYGWSEQQIADAIKKEGLSTGPEISSRLSKYLNAPAPTPAPTPSPAPAPTPAPGSVPGKNLSALIGNGGKSVGQKVYDEAIRLGWSTDQIKAAMSAEGLTGGPEVAQRLGLSASMQTPLPKPSPAPSPTEPGNSQIYGGYALDKYLGGMADTAISDIQKWQIGPNQANPDRGVMKDALQAQIALTGVNYGVARGLMDAATSQEDRLMRTSADLDLRNTSTLMEQEQEFNLAGMEKSNDLSKDYMRAESEEQIKQIKETGTIQTGIAEIGQRGALAQADAARAVGLAQAAAQQFSAEQAAGAERFGAEQAAGAQRFSAEQAAGAQRFGAEQAAGAQRYGAEQQKEAALGSAEFGYRGTLAQAGAQQTVGLAQAGAERYGAEQQKEAALGSALYGMRGQLGSAEYGYQGTLAQASAARDVGFEQAGAERYSSDKQAQASMYGAQQGADASKYGAQQQAEAAKYAADRGAAASTSVAQIEGSTARDVAGISGGYNLEGLKYGQDAETTRAREGYASAERQIGLTGGESRKTIETQGEQSRKTVETEGDQSRQTIRTQGDESRRNLAFDRANAARLAVSMSKR